MTRTVHAPSRLAGVILPALLLVAGCSGGGPGGLVAEPVPEVWERDLLDYRAGLDESFRTDPNTPIHPDDREGFRGLEYWPPDPAYRLVGPIHKHETPEKFQVITTTGKVRPAERYGWIDFELQGKACTLQVYRLLDQRTESLIQSLFLPFTDRTSGKESYPAGRYLNVEGGEEGRFVIDFNRAYNPFCAYGMPERYACPVTPVENRLKVRVEAGEKGYRRHGDGEEG